MVFSKDDKDIGFSAFNFLILITLLELKIVQLCCQFTTSIAYALYSWVIYEPNAQFQLVPFEGEAEDWVWSHKSAEVWTLLRRVGVN